MIAVYQTVNSHAPAIHWWLANDSRFGPQLYESLFLNNNPDDDNIGSIISEVRNLNDIDPDLYENHQESLREMENKEDPEIVDCTSTYFNYNKKYQYPVWSNYFGSCHKLSVPQADKLIFAQSSTEESAFFYMTQYAFNEITSPLAVDRQSFLWWQDHVYVDGKDVGKWREIWYEKYHQKTIDDLMCGKLCYMWQLNFAHWDLYHALARGEEEFDLDYSFSRLFKVKYNPSDINTQKEILNSLDNKNFNYLKMDVEWFNKTDVILDYIGVSSSSKLDDAAKWYSKQYYEAVKRYKRVYNKYYRGIEL